jgi:hypothetical protein
MEVVLIDSKHRSSYILLVSAGDGMVGAPLVQTHRILLRILLPILPALLEPFVAYRIKAVD